VIEAVWRIALTTTSLSHAAPVPPGSLAARAEPRRAPVEFAERWRATRRWVYLACDLVHALFAVLLWLGGYPAWRVGLYSAALLVSVVLHVWVETPRARAREDRGDGRLRNRSELWWLGAMLLEIAVTGGVRSPLFPSNLAAIPINFLQFGWNRQSKWAAAVIVASAAAFLVAPAAWSGPTVPASIYWITLAGAVLATGGTSVYYRALLGRVADENAREALRSREELATHAIARARELEQLGARISHELKNPLSAIKTLVQVSAHETRDPEARERLEVVEREVRRIEETLRDYLSFSRPLERAAPEPVALGELVDDVLALLGGRAKEAQVALRRRGDALAEVDRRRFAEAVLNLVLNALEASPPGEAVQVEIASQDGEAWLTVRDRGRGMPPEVLERIGTPFFTTRAQGTGLGVALARATIAHHDGRLDYRSAPGQGTTATAVLPLHPARRADGARPGGR